MPKQVTLNSQRRRRLFQSALVALTSATPLVSSASSTPLLVPTPKFDANLNWPLGKVAFSLLPLAGGVRRATVQETIVPNKIWTHDQIQGIVNVNVPVRQTTIALESGGLWIHNPVAPTRQHVQRITNWNNNMDPSNMLYSEQWHWNIKPPLEPFATSFQMQPCGYNQDNGPFQSIYPFPSWV